MTAIGFVGLGAMGSRIAGRLLRGNQVYGTNRTPSRASELIGQGMIWRGHSARSRRRSRGDLQHGHRRRRP